MDNHHIQTMSVDRLRDELIYLSTKPKAIANPLVFAMKQELKRRGF